MGAEVTVSLVSFRFCADPAINLDRHGAWLATLAKSAKSAGGNAETGSH